MKNVVLIPARMESTRLPNKPLKKICGIPMVVHVAKRSMLSEAEVVVCTDSADIVLECEKYNINVCLTKSSHTNGTERIAEAALTLGLEQNDIIIDVQGDEPFVKPEYITDVVKFLKSTNYGCVVPHQLIKEYHNPNRVKIVSSGNRILHMSRNDIPFNFGQMDLPLKKHLSIIGFRLDVLNTYAKSSIGELEDIERIELMRLLELYIPIGTFQQAGSAMAVDTIEDYEHACRLMERDALFEKMKNAGLY